MNKKKNILTGFAFFLASLLLFIAVFNILIPKSDQELTKKDFLAQKTKSFRYVAIGDSLTEGVGDTTNQGGFVPILSQSLTDTYHYQVTHDNYGVSGNTSNQILTRMKDKQDIQNSLAKADMMTLTVGNDVMAVIRKHLTKLSVGTFKKPAKSYQERLRQIIELARSENEDLPIYILGIYNPFYLNFPEMTEMQEIINDWNDATESVTKSIIMFTSFQSMINFIKELMVKKESCQHLVTKQRLSTMLCLVVTISTRIILAIKLCQT